MLYTLITFVGLFIVGTAVAIIYYVRAEDYRTHAAELQAEMDKLATPAQRRNLGTLIGKIPARKTVLDAMVDYLNQTVYLIIGGVPEETSAEVKVSTANQKAAEMLELTTAEHLDARDIDPNTTGLARLIEKLKIKMDNTKKAELAALKQLEDLQKRFDDAMQAGFEKEQALLAEKEKYHQQVQGITEAYGELEVLLQQTSDERVRTVTAQLKEQANISQELKNELLKTQAQLRMTEGTLNRAKDRLESIVPPPGIEVAAFRPDGKVILIDPQTNIVHLNIGSDDHVYRGLAFSVYDKNIPIPKDGIGKAEIEVFEVGKTFAAARIIRSEIKRPIVEDDVVANLIWDSDKTNVFVVAGDFDLNADTVPDYDGPDKIKTLIEKWGARVDEAVSVNTDFVVLGDTPKVPRQPSLSLMETYPTAMEKYEAALKRLAEYRQVKTQANALRIPIFTPERFLYFIGYKTQSTRAGAF